jgi:predicted metal-dependent hydrolase
MPKEERILRLDGRDIPYEIRRYRRAKKISVRIVPLDVSGDGRVVLTVPSRGSVRKGERFLAEHAGWVVASLDRLASIPPGLLRPDPEGYRKRRDEAIRFVREKTEYWNRFYGFEYGRITVRDQRTRWGSCSRNGNLSFNWKLILLPEAMADYVVVHELCHLAEFNHSDRFWDLVARAIPSPRRVARELRRM